MTIKKQYLQNVQTGGYFWTAEGQRLLKKANFAVQPKLHEIGQVKYIAI